MLAARSLLPGERKLARVSVFWTITPAAQPNRSGALYCTDRRLIIAKPGMHPLLLLPAWAVLGFAGMSLAGIGGAIAALILLFALRLGLPDRPVHTLELAAISTCTLFPSTGWSRLARRDVVELAAQDGQLLRLCTVQRGRISAEPILAALRSVQIEPG